MDNSNRAAVLGSVNLRPVASIAAPRRRRTSILPEVDSEVFSLALKHFAKAVGAGPQKRIVLVLDRAGWHASKDLVVPEGHPPGVPAGVLA